MSIVAQMNIVPVQATNCQNTLNWMLHSENHTPVGQKLHETTIHTHHRALHRSECEASIQVSF